MALVDYGWTVDLDGVFSAHAAAGLVPGRVVKQSRDASMVVTSEGEQLCEVSGRFRRTALAPSAFPAVGDWAALRRTPDGRFVVEALSSAGAHRGRHTTIARELVRLPDGALLIDTPGMRELGLWIDEDALQRTFHEIDDLARDCRFRDCAHHGEPGCAVEDAVARGAVEPDRLESYRALRREMAFLETRKDEMSRRREERTVGRDFAARREELRRNRPRRTDR